MQIVPTSWYVSGFLAVTTLLMAAGWDHTTKTLHEERIEHTQVVQMFTDRQTEANRKAEVKRVELKKEAEENAKKADLRYGALLAEYRTNLLRFKANQSNSVRPNSGEVRPTEGGNRPSTSTEVLTITLDDAGICAVNTARLQAVREWALDPPH